MSIAVVIQVVGGLLLIMAAATGVIGYFKANISKSTIELYKEDNEALRKRVLTLEEQVVSDNAKIKALENAQVYLASVVTQATAIAEMRIIVDKIAQKVGV